MTCDYIEDDWHVFLDGTFTINASDINTVGGPGFDSGWIGPPGGPQTRTIVSLNFHSPCNIEECESGACFSSSSSDFGLSSSSSQSDSSSSIIETCADPFIEDDFIQDNGNWNFDVTTVGNKTTIDNFSTGPCAPQTDGIFDFGNILNIGLEIGCCYQIDTNLQLSVGEVTCDVQSSVTRLNLLNVYTDCSQLTGADQIVNGGLGTTINHNSTTFACPVSGGLSPQFDLTISFDSNDTCDCPDIMFLTGSIVITKLGSC